MKPEWIEKRKTSDFFFDEIEELRNEKDSVHWDQPLYHGLTDQLLQIDCHSTAQIQNMVPYDQDKPFWFQLA